MRYEVNGSPVARRIYDERGGLEVEMALRNGEAHGPWRRYFADGQLMQERHCLKPCLASYPPPISTNGAQ
jgi:antitoxin component YwqK of YwqJK toxin-antitoxin module